MKYPYPLTGSVILPGTVFIRRFQRSYNCQREATETFAPTDIVGAGGFGYRSPVVKSDGFAPTNYQVWWSHPKLSTDTAWCGNGNYCYGSNGSTQFRTYLSGYSSNRVESPFAINYLRGSSAVSSGFGQAYAINAFRAGTVFDRASIEANNMVLLDLSNQTHQLGITIAEFGKTTRYLSSKFAPFVNGLASLATSKKKFFRWLKRNYKSVFPNTIKHQYSRSKVRHHLRRQPWDKRLAARWMEYQYALMPLAYDVSNAFEFYQTPPPYRFSVKKRVQGVHTIRTSGTQYIAHSRIDYKVIVQHNCQISDPTHHTMNRLGLTPAQFVLGTAYELIPFSFIADWVLKFNDLLKGVSAYQGITFLHGFKSVLFKCEDRVWRNGGTGMHWTNVSEFGKPVELSKTFNDCKGINPPLNANTMSCILTSSGMQRVVLTRPPSYNYEASLDVISKRRLLTVVSLLSIFRR